MIFLLVPMGCFMFVFAEPVVEFFYRHASFTQEDVIASAEFMKLLSVTIFSIGVNAIVTRIFIAMQAIRHLLTGPTPFIEVDREVFERYNAELDEALSHCIWSHEGMTTYYRNGAGRIVVSSPWTYIEYWNRMREFAPAEYVDAQAVAASAASGGS